MRRSRHDLSNSRSTVVAMAVAVSALLASSACTTPSAGESTQRGASGLLRVGVAQLSTTSQIAGLRQLSGLLSVEGLARPGEDGQMQPWLAERWTPANGGRSVRITLRANVKFHDGTPLN